MRLVYTFIIYAFYLDKFDFDKCLILDIKSTY